MLPALSLPTWLRDASGAWRAAGVVVGGIGLLGLRRGAMAAIGANRQPRIPLKPNPKQKPKLNGLRLRRSHSIGLKQRAWAPVPQGRLIHSCNRQIARQDRLNEMDQVTAGGGFEALVAQLLLPDNDVRKVAEDLFDRVKGENADFTTGSLVQVLRSSANMEHRSFAAIMLRKVRQRRPATAAPPPPAILGAGPVACGLGDALPEPPAGLPRRHATPPIWNRFDRRMSMRRCSPATTRRCGSSAAPRFRCVRGGSSGPNSGGQGQRRAPLWGRWAGARRGAGVCAGGV